MTFNLETLGFDLRDINPPSWDTTTGIQSLTVGSGIHAGSLLAAWGAASDVSTPVLYQVFIKAGTATGLFDDANKLFLVDDTSARIFALPNGSFLSPLVTYYVGVRAVDSNGNYDTNTVSLSATPGSIAGVMTHPGMAGGFLG